MVVNPDPKPGRWLLPLAVLAMFAFTFMFVRTLPEAEVEPRPVTTVGTPTTAGNDPGNETTPGEEATDAQEEGATGEATPTTTTLPPAVVSYLASIEALGEQLASLAAEVREVNSAWDERSILYAETEERLVAVMEDVVVWQDNVVQLNAPSVLAASHQDMLASSTRAAVAATAIVEGLRSTDTGEARRGSAADFDAAASAFVSAVQRAKITIGF